MVLPIRIRSERENREQRSEAIFLELKCLILRLEAFDRLRILRGFRASGVKKSEEFVSNYTRSQLIFRSEAKIFCLK